MRALVVEEAVESGKPESGSPAALRLTKYLQDFGEGFVGPVALYRVERVAGEVVDAFVLKGEDGSVAFPLVRLGAGILWTVSGHLRDIASRQEVAAPQNSGFGIDHHARLGECSVRDGDVREQRPNDLFEGVGLALSNELGEEGRYLTEDSLEDELLAVV